MSAIAKFRLTVIGGMSIDGQDSVGAFISCEPAALRGITALEAQVAAAERVAQAYDDAGDRAIATGIRIALAAYRAAKGE